VRDVAPAQIKASQDPYIRQFVEGLSQGSHTDEDQGVRAGDLRHHGKSAGPVSLEAKVGAFVFAGLALMGTAIFLLGTTPSSRRYEISVGSTTCQPDQERPVKALGRGGRPGPEIGLTTTWPRWSSRSARASTSTRTRTS